MKPLTNCGCDADVWPTFRAGLSWNNQYELTLIGTNLLDEEFIIDGGNTGGSFGITTFIAGPSRLIGVQESAKFGGVVKN